MFRRKSKTKEKEPVPSPRGDDSALLELYETFADPEEPECINMEGISSLCEQLGLDPASDVRVLVLLWQLGANTKPGIITKPEFLAGMKKLRCKSISDVQQKLPSFDPGFLEKKDFRERDIVKSLLPIVLDMHRAPHLTHFLQCPANTRVNLDQWDSFLQFQDAIPVDLRGFDDDGAWPLLLDEYVAWRKNGSK